MITVISPAKKISKVEISNGSVYTNCEFLSETRKLATQLKKMDPAQIGSLMGISESLSLLNWERYKKWRTPFTSENSRQAMYMFEGDTYKGLNANSFSSDDINFSQQKVRILSGLYGLLRPMDLIMPYRLEMGTKLSNDQGPDLYSFWKTKLTNSLNKLFQNSKNRYLINCSSLEYFKSIDLKLLNAKVITPIFKELRNGSPKIVSFFAKNARGAMTRFVVKNKIDRPEGLLDFNLDGYNYNKKLSEPDSPVFLRKNS